MPAPVSPGPVFLTKLFDQTLATDSASFDTGATIPQGFAHLQCWVQALGDTGSGQRLGLRFNNDSGSNYRQSSVYGGNGTPGADASVTTTSIGILTLNSTASEASQCVIQIPNYESAAFYKRVTSVQAEIDYSVVFNGRWANTAAITRIQLVATTGLIKANSRLTIYGMP